jgi:hypothetical protein
VKNSNSYKEAEITGKTNGDATVLMTENDQVCGMSVL